MGEEHDRRRHPRFPVDHVYGTLRTPKDVKVVDLSRSGLSFLTGGWLERGTHCFLELRHHFETVNVEVKVLWTQRRYARHRVTGKRVRVTVAGAAIVDLHRDAPGGFWDRVEVDPQALEAELREPDAETAR